MEDKVPAKVAISRTSVGNIGSPVAVIGAGLRLQEI
jgi:hypothetical protein